MKKVAITAQVPANEKKGTKQLGPVTIQVDYPDYEADPKKAMTEAIAAFGEKAILSNALDSFIITLQGNIRSGLAKGENQAALQTRLGAAKMGVSIKGVRVNTEDAIVAKLQSMTPEQQIAYINELKAKAAKK
jgi:hypothetical protein